MNTMATQNRQLMEEIFAALEVGDGQPFLDSLAGDFVWRMIGTTDWSGTTSARRRSDASS
jgi:ketosteroid isomerase-like protein